MPELSEDNPFRIDADVGGGGSQSRQPSVGTGKEAAVVPVEATADVSAVEFHPNMTISEARRLLGSKIHEGASCPVCDQYAKVYRRRVNSGMARSLIEMYRIRDRDWVYLPTEIGARSREESKLRFWNLVEEKLDPRSDGGRSGWWRVTEVGERWLRGEIMIKKYAHIYNNQCLGLAGDEITIQEALGKKFDLHELLSGS